MLDAAAILRALAAGVQPEFGALFAPAGPLCAVDIDAEAGSVLLTVASGRGTPELIRWMEGCVGAIEGVRELRVSERSPD